MGKWLEILKAVGPVVAGLIPGVDPRFVPLIVQGIGEAEALQGAGGLDKKAHVLELVTIGAKAANVAVKTPINVPALTSASSKAIDAVVEAVNAVHEQTAPKTAA